MRASLPSNEQERLEALKAYNILDSLPEQGYDDIVFLASMITETPIALVSLIDSERQWFKAKTGLDASETHRDFAFCAHAILDPHETLTVGDATKDARFADNPLVLGDPKIRFYAGAPLVTSEGHPLGTLCVIDRVPRELTQDKQAALKALARQVMVQLELGLIVGKLQSATRILQADKNRLSDSQMGLIRMNQKLEKESSTDALTGLVNRRGFDHELDQEFDRAMRYHNHFSLLLLDLDRFKYYNDTFGHPAGDEALRIAAKIMTRQVRGTDIVCRYGGEEFACILINANKETAVQLAERIRAAFEAQAWTLRPMTISIGVATVHQHTEDRSALISDADQALYAAKKAGRNQVQVAGNSDHTAS